MAGYDGYAPSIENPYPQSWRKVRGFECRTQVHLTRPVPPRDDWSRKPEEQYICTREFHVVCHVDGHPHDIVMPAGMLTDLASAPWWARWLVPKIGPHMEAVIAHDYLSIAWQDLTENGASYGARWRDFRFSNAVLREGLMVAGYPRWVAQTVAWTAGIPWAWRRFYRVNPSPRYVRDTPSNGVKAAPDRPPSA